MEDKKYEAGRVEISSAEYRDLVTEATENRIAASEARSDKWKAESERDKLKAELEKAQAEIEGLKTKLQVYSSWGERDTNQSSWSPLRDCFITAQGGKQNGEL